MTYQPVEKVHPGCVRPLWPNYCVALPPRILRFDAVACLVFGHNDSASPAERLFQRTAMALAYIGMGANLDDRAAALRRATAVLDTHDRLEVKAASPVYETAPIGVTEQPMFLNAVLAVETDLDARALLECLLAVERRFGRIREQRWGPRLLDLDILLYGNAVIRRRGLQIPHPRLHERAFVLVPLCELAPRGRHPVFDKTFSELAESIVPTQEVRKLEGVSLLSVCT